MEERKDKADWEDAEARWKTHEDERWERMKEEMLEQVSTAMEEGKEDQAEVRAKVEWRLTVMEKATRKGGRSRSDEEVAAAVATKKK